MVKSEYITTANRTKSSGSLVVKSKYVRGRVTEMWDTSCTPLCNWLVGLLVSWCFERSQPQKDYIGSECSWWYNRQSHEKQHCLRRMWAKNSKENIPNLNWQYRNKVIKKMFQEYVREKKKSNLLKISQNNTYKFANTLKDTTLKTYSNSTFSDSGVCAFIK